MPGPAKAFRRSFGGTHRPGAEWRRDSQLRAQKSNQPLGVAAERRRRPGSRVVFAKARSLEENRAGRAVASDAIQRGEVLVMLNLHKTFTSVFVALRMYSIPVQSVLERFQ
jgi:hypothetical protein